MANRAVIVSAFLTLLVSAVSAPLATAQENKTPDAYVGEEVEEENIWVTLSLPFYNKYYYRGIELYPDASFQPSLSVSHALGEGAKYGVVSASVWSHIPMADDQVNVAGFDGNGNFFNGEVANKFVEVDPSVNYDLSLEGVTFSVGHIWYTDPHEGSTTFFDQGQEVDFGPAAPPLAKRPVDNSVSVT